MAFLNNITSRPSCVFSDLPSQFMEPLVRDLRGSVAVSTCNLEELPRAVQLRGASMAVIGASAKSYEIAEQLSHDELSVKVFLVRVDDNFPKPIYKNGFAGIVDLRTDHKRFAETLRQAATSPDSFPTRTPKQGKRPSFLQMLHLLHRKSAGITNISELILAGFLETAQVSQGLFISPVSKDQFKVVSGIGFDRNFQTDCTLPPNVYSALMHGNTVEALQGKSINLSWRDRPIQKFSFALPLIAKSEMCGCLLGNSITPSEVLREYGAFAAHLWVEAQKMKLIESVRSQAISSLPGSNFSVVLVSPEEKVIHLEDCPEEWDLEIGEIVKVPRLRGAVEKALHGHSGSIDLMGHSVRYSCQDLSGKSHGCLIVSKSPKIGTLEIEDFPSEVLLKILNSELDSVPVDSDLKIIGPENISPDISLSLAVLARTLTKLLERKLAFKATLIGDQITLIFEAEEVSLPHSLIDQVSSIKNHWLMNLALRMIAHQLTLITWKAGAFGGGLQFSISNCAADLSRV